MARPGPAQSETKIGRTPSAPWTEVANVAFTDGPELPEHLASCELLAAWWAEIASMPHCVLWSPTDWRYALDTAIQKHAIYTDDAPVTLWTEVRRREDQMGTTLEARRKLGIRYVDAPAAVEPEAGQATVTSLDGRRSRLSG